MITKLRNKTEGFTIIEVLIVLAIAGLIMVVVFLAVPALQRNQRNEESRNDARNLLSAYNEVSSNKGGSVLLAADQAAVVTAGNPKTLINLTIAAYAAGTIATPAEGNAIIRTNSKCTAQDSGVALQGATRQVAIYFSIDNKTPARQIQCLES